MDVLSFSRSASWPLALLGLTVLLAVAGVKPAHAEAKFLDGGNRSLPPIGWVQFCQAHSADCQNGAQGDDMIRKDSAEWSALRTINDSVNRAVDPITDEDHWGTVERWSYPTDGAGDCEDYVLEKRKQLIAAGVSPNALMIAVVLDKEGLGHAVLIARTSIGDMVLDNQETSILQWRDTGYVFLKRQDNRDINRWVALDNRLGARDSAASAATP
jgi:predicted transglutaminase-like cysteine proteinase